MISNMSNGIFYVKEPDTGYQKVCEIKNVDFVDDNPVEDHMKVGINGNMYCCIENTKINRNILLTLIHGRRITNNWLKMHGGVMSRKKR